MQYTRRLLTGVATFVPGLANVTTRRTGGTGSAVYCYVIWLRHLITAARHGLPCNPRVVAEIGPGDSLGTGLAALLSGASRYYAFDAVRHASSPRSLVVLDGLVDRYAARAAIPEQELGIRPVLDSPAFPHDILGDERLVVALEPARVERIRRALTRIGEDQQGILIAYEPSGITARAEPREDVDLIVSQSALEHVDDLAGAYAAMYRWLPQEATSRITWTSSHTASPGPGTGTGPIRSGVAADSRAAAVRHQSPAALGAPSAAARRRIRDRLGTKEQSPARDHP